MKVVPLRDFVVVSKHEEASKTAGGIYIPTTVEEKVVTGTVVAVGSGKVTASGTVLALEVNVNDTVAFNRHTAAEIKVEGVSYLLLKEDQVMCVLK